MSNHSHHPLDAEVWAGAVRHNAAHLPPIEETPPYGTAYKVLNCQCGKPVALLCVACDEIVCVGDA